MSVWTERINDNCVEHVFTKLIDEQQFGADDNWIVAYDLDLFLERLAYLINSFGDNVIHALAIKCCPLVSILKKAVKAGMGLECASFEEVHLAIAAGCSPDRIVFDSPAKTRNELLFALKKGIRINVDNFDELQAIADLREADSQSKIGIRVNPEVGVGSIAMTSVAGNVSKFGVSLSKDRDDIIKAFKRYSWLNGLHVHIGSQGCKLDQLVSAGEVVDQLKEQIHSELNSERVEWIDIGGGLPADYGFETKAIDVKDYVEQLRERAPGLFNQTVVTEFGRSILANCAWAVSRIQYLKENPTGLTCVIHYGADFLMRPVYAAKDWKHQYVVLDSCGMLSSAARKNLSIAGPLCFSGDYLIKNESCPEPELEGFIVVKDVGAYTLSTWSRHCNRRLPKVYGYSKSGNGYDISLLYQGESVQDVVSFWS